MFLGAILEYATIHNIVFGSKDLIAIEFNNSIIKFINTSGRRDLGRGQGPIKYNILSLVRNPLSKPNYSNNHPEGRIGLYDYVNKRKYSTFYLNNKLNP